MANGDEVKKSGADPGETTSNFDAYVGTEWLSLDPDDARCRVDVRDDLRQPYGILHGGVYSTLVESLCSYVTAVSVYGEGKIAMGQSIEVSFLRPVSAGHAEVRAVARHRGRSSWIWQAEVLDAQERLCGLAKMTMAVRPAPQGG
ncbi:MAG: PaaI family thioesterase [Solirubrobacterales bacterium]